MKLRRILVGMILAAWIVGCAGDAGAGDTRQWSWTGVERVVAIGDVHGAHDNLTAILEASSLIDSDGRWIGGEAHLVMLGDVTDRGPKPRESLDLLIRLQPDAAAAGGRVHYLLGNHDVLNLIGDLRYVSDADFASFAGAQDDAERKREVIRILQRANMNNGNARRLRSQLSRTYPEGFFARRLAFSMDGVYGRWLLEQQILVVINGVVFVHGGLPATLLSVDADEVNTVAMGELKTYLEAKAQLFASGALPPDILWIRQQTRVRRITMNKGMRRDVEAARIMLKVGEGLAFSNDGPLWYRGTALHPAEEESELISEILDHFGAATVVVGHTPTHTGRITTRFKGAVIQADTGMLTSYYGGHASALEFRGDLIFERYLGSTATPIAAQQWEFAASMFKDDAEIEDFLATAPVAKMADVGSGSTRPMRVALADDGRRGRAVFKTFEAETTAHFEATDVRCNESYAHEVAAYLIDRLLNLGMVPPTVIRTIDGVEGSLQLWVEGAFNEVNRSQENLEPEDPRTFEWQRDRARAFDWLILNPERAGDDLLYTIREGGWQVHLIDHSQAFAPAALSDPEISARRPKIDDDLKSRIDELDLEELRLLLGDLLEDAELEALLTRVRSAQRR